MKLDESLGCSWRLHELPVTPPPEAPPRGPARPAEMPEPDEPPGEINDPPPGETPLQDPHPPRPMLHWRAWHPGRALH